MPTDLPPERHLRWRTWLREPLLHFLTIGAALFAVDHVLSVRAEDPHTITVDESQDKRDREVFKQQHGREPDAAELQEARRSWLDNEVLYREGIAMQMDRGDPLIRDRVIFKMLNLIEAGLATPTFDEKALREWFGRNRENYGAPGSPAEFEQVAALVLQDWLDSVMAEQRSAAVMAMEQRYTVKVAE
jgi:hypothetical protein